MGPGLVRRCGHGLGWALTSLPSRGGYNSDDITRVGVGGGGALSREAVMTE